MEVHNKLGCGFQEVIYQRALEIEMRNISLHFLREFEMTIINLIYILVSVSSSFYNTASALSFTSELSTVQTSCPWISSK